MVDYYRAILPLLISEDMNYIDEDIKQQIPFLIRDLKKLNLDEEEATALINEIIEITKEEYVPHVIRWIANGLAWPLSKPLLIRYLDEYDKVRAADPVALKKPGKYETFPDLVKDVNRAIGPSATVMIELGIDPTGINLIYRDNNYIIFQVTDPNSLVKLSSDAAWCTKGLGQAKHYLGLGNVYLVYLNGKKYSLIHAKSNQIMDIHNHTLPRDEKLLRILKSKVPDVIPAIMYLYKERDPQLERQMLEKGEVLNIARYVAAVMASRWPEGEEVLLARPNAEAISLYTNVVRNFAGAGNWVKKVKTRILELANQSLKNIELLIKFGAAYGQLWPEMEEIINRTAKAIVSGTVPAATLLDNEVYHDIIVYIQNVKKGRWPEIEAVLMASKNADAIMKYTDALPESEQSWSEADDILFGSGNLIAILRIAIKRKVKLSDEIEATIIQALPVISKDLYSNHQAWDLIKKYIIIRGGWPEVESYVLLNEGQVEAIIDFAEKRGQRWPEAEAKFLNSPHHWYRDEFIVKYAMRVIKGPWPEAEPYLINNETDLKESSIRKVMDYADFITRGGKRWEYGEKFLINSPKLSIQYAAMIGGWPLAIKKYGVDKKWLMDYASVYSPSDYARPETLSALQDSVLPTLREFAVKNSDSEVALLVRRLYQDREIVDESISQLAENGTPMDYIKYIMTIHGDLSDELKLYEDKILQDPNAAYYFYTSGYGRSVETLHKLMDIFINYPELATKFATGRGERWQAAEPNIKMVPKYWEMYKKKFKLA